MLVAVATLALSACGSPEQTEAAGNTATGGQVATLTSPSAAVSASPKAQRPRERLDTTPEEYEQMLGPYTTCMTEHGVNPKGVGGTGSGTGAKPASEKDVAEFDEANRVCEPQYLPLPPWEKDPANPEAKDFARDVVKCLRAKGVKYVEVDADGISIALGGDQNDSRSISMGLDLIPGCERKIAAALKD
ncbi:hypothetical protein ADL15_31050 [Actinoplanes awajinensis subsp. mycoplanecinus]|uniref:Uncharacterized protein n=1 Tax=Actinoplanes awajinensis subsp. mycoplanecinus TaxID=135947 RepID=A0A124G9E3_9ACTN|nr:hypothetical protein ADL15_31050 [Actinoplanes awajinensis subsp. mycoplanecinus]